VDRGRCGYSGCGFLYSKGKIVEAVYIMRRLAIIGSHLHWRMSLFVLLQSEAALAEIADESQRAYLEIRTLVESYAGRDVGPKYDAATRSVLDRGRDAIPHLVRLFQETNDDHTRAAAVFTMASIRDGRQALVSLVERELEKPEELWGGSVWVFTAINQFRKIDPAEARRLAPLLLVGSEGLAIYSSPALVILREHGTADEIPILLDSARRMRTVGRSVEDIRYANFAEATAEIIKERADGRGGGALIGEPLNPSGVSKKDYSKVNDSDIVSNEDSPIDSNRSAVAIIAGVVATIVMVYFYRKHR